MAIGTGGHVSVSLIDHEVGHALEVLDDMAAYSSDVIWLIAATVSQVNSSQSISSDPTGLRAGVIGPASWT